jgi:hypothetical protein
MPVYKTVTQRRYLDQRLRLHLLRAIDSIDNQRSLLNAPAALGISQPSLTKSLRELVEIAEGAAVRASPAPGAANRGGQGSDGVRSDCTVRVAAAG